MGVELTDKTKFTLEMLQKSRSLLLISSTIVPFSKNTTFIQIQKNQTPNTQLPTITFEQLKTQLEISDLERHTQRSPGHFYNIVLAMLLSFGALHTIYQTPGKRELQTQYSEFVVKNCEDLRAKNALKLKQKKMDEST